MTTPTHTPKPDQADTPPAGESLLRLPEGRRPVPTKSRLATRRVPILAYAIFGLLLLGGAVGGAAALGWWQTDCGGANEAVVASGTLTPEGVKGSMTVEQVAKGFPGLTTAEVLSFFGVPADTAVSTQLKTLVQNGSTRDVTDFRTWLAERPAP
jgi:hypothetical protein